MQSNKFKTKMSSPASAVQTLGEIEAWNCKCNMTTSLSSVRPRPLRWRHPLWVPLSQNCIHSIALITSEQLYLNEVCPWGCQKNVTLRVVAWIHHVLLTRGLQKSQNLEEVISVLSLLHLLLQRERVPSALAMQLAMIYTADLMNGSFSILSPYSLYSLR